MTLCGHEVKVIKNESFQENIYSKWYFIRNIDADTLDNKLHDEETKRQKL